MTARRRDTIRIGLAGPTACFGPTTCFSPTACFGPTTYLVLTACFGPTFALGRTALSRGRLVRGASEKSECQDGMDSRDTESCELTHDAMYQLPASERSPFQSSRRAAE
jgi:hypothetical protein